MPPPYNVREPYRDWFKSLTPEQQESASQDPSNAHMFKGKHKTPSDGGPSASRPRAGSPDLFGSEETPNRSTASGSTRLNPISSNPSTVQGGTISSDSGQGNTPSSQINASMPLTGTGAATAAGGASSDGMMEYQIERPLSKFGDTISVYKKSHKFMTFGIAPAILQPAANQVDTFLTTYLAEIPWHIPALYLNQSEFDLLQQGSHVISLEVEVFYRGSTIQFETGASATGLATLNQINDIAVGYALNKTGWGSNVSLRGFGTGQQSMVPTAIARPLYEPVTGVYRGMIADYYGRNNNDANFKNDIPKHQVGRQTFLYNYFAVSTAGIATPPQAGRIQFGGWPCIAEKIEQYDGKTVVNKPVAHMKYEPKMGFIKTPLKTLAHGMPAPSLTSALNIPTNGNLVNARIAVAQNSGSTIVPANRDTDINENTATLNNDLTIQNIYTPIEKAQWARSGVWGEADAHVQPSLHIGVQPVPALTTASLLTEDSVFNQWTDTRAYWDVNCTMVVKNTFPTRYPYAANANVPIGEQVFAMALSNRPANAQNPSNDGATYAGLYAQQIPNLPVPS